MSPSPLSLTHRKLSVSEIASYLEMDEKNVAAYLKAMEIQGYYSLIPKNFPPGKEFVMYNVDLNGKIHGTKSFFVCPDGTLVTPLDETTVNLSNNFLVFAKYLPGEPVDFVLGSKEGDFYASTRIVPNPIETVADHKQRLSVQIASSDRKHYRVFCEGLEPFGTYMLITSFENEKLAHTLQANDEGQLAQMIGPTIPWIKSGQASLELRGDGINRPLILKFAWAIQE